MGKRVSRKALEKRTTPELVESFKTAALSDSPWDMASAVCLTLIARGEARALLALLGEGNAGCVRVWAAGMALYFAYDDGERALKELMLSPDRLVALDASLTLETWRMGQRRPLDMSKKDWLAELNRRLAESTTPDVAGAIDELHRVRVGGVEGDATGTGRASSDGKYRP
jgi:hypothetical protein